MPRLKFKTKNIRVTVNQPLADWLDAAAFARQMPVATFARQLWEQARERDFRLTGRDRAIAREADDLLHGGAPGDSSDEFLGDSIPNQDAPRE